MKEQVREDPHVMAAAERQMRAWVHNQEVGERTIHRFDTPQKVRLGPYLALSREPGAGASEIAQRLGQELGWEVLDKNILEYIAQRIHASKELLKSLDETESNWACDIMAAWFDRSMVGQEKYLHHMVRVMLNAARSGRVIIVGRGASFLLPRDRGLSVRLVASEDYRAQRVMRQQQLDGDSARELVRRLARGQADFVHRHFHKDIADPHNYDLVLNVGRLGIEAAADLIVAAMKHAGAI
jgi:cytidylate kinase